MNDELRACIEQKLRAAGIDNARFEAGELYRFLEKRGSLTTAAADALRARRASREPLQYILGEWDFMGDKYFVDENCLIPRPETELLCEYVINHVPAGRMADLCCGSGCIAVSALKRRPDLTALCADVSGPCIELARRNAAAHGVESRIIFRQIDVFNDNIYDLLKDCASLVSNPPYLSAADMETVRREGTEVSREPELALYGGEDGLDFYRRLTDILARSAHIRFAAFETGMGQAPVVAAMLASAGFEVHIINDYAGIGRVVVCRTSCGN